MIIFDNLDLVVRDVPAAVAFFQEAVGVVPRYTDANFAELDTGTVTIMLTPAALVPVAPARGVIVHFQVEDVAEALARAQAAGATILRQPALTDWGTEAAFIAGPEEIVVEFYRRIE